MRSNPVPDAAPTRARCRLIATILIACSLVGGAAGCEELDARRKIQEAGKLYEKGRFDEAGALYEQALQLAPDLEIAHYNAGLTYLKLFRPGLETPENLGYADKAAFHMGKYLELDPNDNTVVGLLTQLWLEAGRNEQAIQYWERELVKSPKNVEVMQILSGIYRQANQWKKSVEMYYQIADVEIQPAAKAGAYKDIARLASSKLFSRTQRGMDVLEIADIGIAALQKAEPLVPDDPETQTYLGVMYMLRSEAHQAAWAQAIDKSSERYHRQRAGALRKALDPPKPAGEPAGSEDSAGGDRPTEPAGEGAQPAGAGTPAGEQAGARPAGESEVGEAGGDKTSALSKGESASGAQP